MISPKIVIIDDLPDSLEMLERILGKDEVKMIVYPNDESALKGIEFSPPDLILLDIDKPNMDAFEVAKRLKSSESTADIPLLFLSSANDKTTMVKGFACGVNDFISRPFDVNEVKARVNTHLALSLYKKRYKEENVLKEEFLQSEAIELFKSNIDLELSNKFKAEMLILVSQELRSPLSNIFGIADMFFNEALNRDDVSIINDFGASKNQILQILDDIEFVRNFDPLKINRVLQSLNILSLWNLGAEEAAFQIPLNYDDSILSNTDSFIIHGNDRVLIECFKRFILLSKVLNDPDCPLGNLSLESNFFRIAIYLNSSELPASWTGEFFEVYSFVRASSKADVLGLSPVILHNLILAEGGTLNLITNDKGSNELVMKIPRIVKESLV